MATMLSPACGSKKDANKRNFKEAVQDELDRQPMCVAARVPQDVPSWKGQLKTDEDLEALVRAGLVKRIQKAVPRDVMDFAFDDKRPKQVPGYHYEWSSAAKKYTAKIHTAMGDPDQLCFGKRKVIEIVRYTEPSPLMGITVSNVTFLWKVVDIADWARNSDIEKHFLRDRSLATESPKEAQMGLALSNDGWHAARTF